MRKMMKYGKAYGGADPELIEGDVFRIVAKVPEYGVGEGSETSEAQFHTKSRLESRLESRLAAKVLLILDDGEFGKSGLAERVGHKTVSGELHKQIKRLVHVELIEMTIPDKPTSRLQKYRLTDKGRAVLKGMTS